MEASCTSQAVRPDVSNPMTATLACHIEGSAVFGSEPTKRLENGRMTVGRGPDCDWVLNDPDRALSKQHCIISSGPDGFSLTDTSTNGVFVDTHRAPVGRGQSVPLSDGQLVIAGPYRIRISIATTADAVAAVLPAALEQAAEAWIGSNVPAAGFGAGRPPVQAGWNAPPDPEALGATGLTLPGNTDTFSALAQSSETASPLATMIRMPIAKAVLPMDWDAPPTGAPASPVNPLAPPPLPAATTTGFDAALDAFSAGAGLPPGSLDGVDPRVAFHEFGRMVRSSVLGLRDLLATRKLAKAELRVAATKVKASGNNALKLSPDAERALLAIAGQPMPGFLPGAEAIEEGMRDLKAHELALVATLSLLLNDISARLDPAVIRGKVGVGWNLLSASRRAQCWDEYEAAYASLAGKAVEPGAVAPLMARFAEGYAEQVDHATQPPAAS